MCGIFFVASTISLMKKLFLLSATVFPIALSAQAFMLTRAVAIRPTKHLPHGICRF